MFHLPKAKAEGLCSHIAFFLQSTRSRTGLRGVADEMIYLNGPHTVPGTLSLAPRTALCLSSPPIWLPLLCPLCWILTASSSWNGQGPCLCLLDLSHSTSILSPGGLSQVLTTMSSFCPLKLVSYAHLKSPSDLLKLKCNLVPFSPSNIQAKTANISAPPIVFPVSINDTSIFLNAQVENPGSSLPSSSSNT